MEQEPKYPVILRVYDLSNGLASLHSERLLGVKLDGIWHTSLEVYNKEIYFQNGIVQGVPGNCGIPVKVIEYGHTEVTEEITNSYLEDLKEKYNPASYHLFMNNCNHFSEDLLNFLTGQSIPEDIRQLPELVMKNPMFGALMCMMNQNQPKSEQ